MGRYNLKNYPFSSRKFGIYALNSTYKPVENLLLQS